MLIRVPLGMTTIGWPISMCYFLQTSTTMRIYVSLHTDLFVKFITLFHLQYIFPLFLLEMIYNLLTV